MSGFGKLFVCFALIATLIVVTAPGAKASTLQFALTSDHCTGGCLGGASSAGTITITDVSSGVVDVSVVLNSGFKFVSTGFDTDFGFNLAGNPTITFSNVASGFTPNANPETAGSLHMDGTGFFEYGVNCTACGNGGSNPQSGPLTFRITDGAGFSTSSFEQNANGQYFAVDVLGNGNTGAVDASAIKTPEPASIFLLGSALLGLGFVRKKFAHNV